MKNNRLHRKRKMYFELTDRIEHPLDLYQHLPFQIAVVSNLLQLNRDVNIRDIVELEPRELRVILNIGSYMPITSADIAYQSRLDSYTVTRAVKKLQLLELVAIEVDTSNKKSKYLVLTEQGIVVYRKLCKQIEERENKLEACLSAEEKELLMKLLSKLEDSAEELLASKALSKLSNNEVIPADQKEIIRWHKKSQ